MKSAHSFILRFGTCSAVALSVASATPARANGTFPAAGQIVVDPSDPMHIVVRTTFGLVITRDRTTWDWVCENAAGYVDIEPGIALTQGGSILAGVDGGVSRTHGNACAWATAVDMGAFVPDVSIHHDDPTIAVAITSEGGANVSRFWESTDDAETWKQVGTDIPGEFLSHTVDVAPSDPLRVYVSGLMRDGGDFVGAMARSADYGRTWDVIPIPESTSATAPFIGAIDPNNADVLYVRLNGAPGRLLVSTDAGETWTEAFSGMGFLKAFALSPDGTRLLVGGENDGIWEASTTDLFFHKASPLGARCLTWTEGGIYACANEYKDGFFVGLSPDDTLAFEPVLHMPCIRGPIECPAETTVAEICTDQWPMVGVQIGTWNCSGAGGGGGSGPVTAGQGGPNGSVTGVGGSGGSALGPSTGEGPTGPTGAAGAGGAGSSDAPSPSEGCGCSIPSRHASPNIWAAAFALAALLGRRRDGRTRSTRGSKTSC